MAGEDILVRIIEAFKQSDFDEIRGLVQTGLDKKIDASNLLNNGLIAGIREVGEQFRRGEVYLPEMMLAADAWQKGMDLLKPLLASERGSVQHKGRVVIGTVKGDVHSLGKNIVITMLKAANFDVVDIGVDKPASSFIQEAEKHNADIIAVSALMTTTMPFQREVIEHLKASEKRADYYVMVGGGSTTAAWSEEIGADAYGETAADAVALAEAYMTRLKGGASS